MSKKIHVGKLIQEKMRKDGRKVSWLARQISCDRNHIYRIYQQEHLHPALLAQICILLEIDLFALYSEFVHEEIKQKDSKT